MSPYEQPLDPSRSETRLLTLLPSPNFDAEIQCLLDVVSLDETTDFEALSYVWGDPSIREPISVGGENVLVTTNLIAALRRLRQPESRRVLWVDAVCIDQGHTGEKNTSNKVL
ncbi:HET domain protein [Apiospora arundinis]